MLPISVLIHILLLQCILSIAASDSMNANREIINANGDEFCTRFQWKNSDGKAACAAIEEKALAWSEGKKYRNVDSSFWLHLTRNGQNEYACRWKQTPIVHMTKKFCKDIGDQVLSQVDVEYCTLTRRNAKEMVTLSLTVKDEHNVVDTYYSTNPEAELRHLCIQPYQENVHGGNATRSGLVENMRNRSLEGILLVLLVALFLNKLRAKSFGKLNDGQRKSYPTSIGNILQVEHKMYEHTLFPFLQKDVEKVDDAKQFIESLVQVSHHALFKRQVTMKTLNVLGTNYLWPAMDAVLLPTSIAMFQNAEMKQD